MAETQTCPRCGNVLVGDSPGGHCPHCLLQLALNPADSVADASESTIRIVMPGENALLEKPGDRIGRYKLLQQIGEGGCGVVYMAEQFEPVRRRVALKVIKPGMDSKQVLARFEAERQALALMDHPNIAKVLDAGATENGRPYFVMELVKGIPITRYCDEKQLTTESRLNLFVLVCQAIQHAHQKGIIHRDIKPSNILVADHDGTPVPKIIDFGIAKATTGQQLTDKTLFTAFEQFIGTPAYMSPEQATLSGLDIDTRSDIYSLGVLLYELLTGKTPFDAKELLVKGLDEIRRVIREVEPQRPSTRLSTLEASEQTTVARQRQSESPKLQSVIRGDLDWIVMKALEKDRTRRYETANGLAADIQRHLNNELVVARPPSNVYRFHKMVKRNKFAVAAAGLIALVLLLGIVASTWQALRATRAEREQSRLRSEAESSQKKAQLEAIKSGQVARFLEDMLSGIGPIAAAGRDTTLLHEVMDKTIVRVGKDLKDQPDIAAELRMTVGRVYVDIGEYKKAEAELREALTLRKQVFGKENTNVADSLYFLALTLGREYKLNEAETLFREAYEIKSKIYGKESLEATASLIGFADQYDSRGKLVEAEKIFREVLQTRRKLVETDSVMLSVPLLYLGNNLRKQHKLIEAENTLREGLAMQTRIAGTEDDPRVAACNYYLAYALDDEEKLNEAETLYRKALATYRKLGTNTLTQDLSNTLYHLGRVLRKQEKYFEAEALMREALLLRRKSFGDEHPSTMSVIYDLYDLCRQRGELNEAQAFIREFAAIDRKRNRNYPESFLNSEAELAVFLKSIGKAQEADDMYRKYIERNTPAAESGSDAALNGIAWLLATSSDASVRNGNQATVYALKSATNTKRLAPAILDTLAAAYAESGNYSNAVAVQHEAIALLKDEVTKSAFTTRLKLYESNKPYHCKF